MFNEHCSVQTVRMLMSDGGSPLEKNSHLEIKLSGIFWLQYWDMGRKLDVDMESFIHIFKAISSAVTHLDVVLHKCDLGV